MHAVVTDCQRAQLHGDSGRTPRVFFFASFPRASKLRADSGPRSNSLLESQGFKAPTVRKTGTTIVGLVYKDGVVLGADTRATGGTIVCDKNCEKIHYIAPNIWCCGAGTAADTEHTTELISSKVSGHGRLSRSPCPLTLARAPLQLALHRLATGKASRLVTASTLLSQLLFRYQGEVPRHWSRYAALPAYTHDEQGKSALPWCWAAWTWRVPICTVFTRTARWTSCRS